MPLNPPSAAAAPPPRGKTFPHGEPAAADTPAASAWTALGVDPLVEGQHAGQFQAVGQDARAVQQQGVGEADGPARPRAHHGHPAAQHRAAALRLAASMPMIAGRGLTRSRAWKVRASERVTTAVSAA